MTPDGRSARPGPGASGGPARGRFLRLLPWLLALGLLTAAAPRVHDYGLTWDEPTYFRFAERQGEWIADVLRAPWAEPSLDSLLAAPRIAEVWLQDADENGHPPLNETWMGTVGGLLRLAGAPPLTAFRLSIALLFALTALLIFHLSAVRDPWREPRPRGASTPDATGGAIAVLVLAGTPAVWAHAHLGATEAMQLFFWCASALVLPRALQSPRGLLLWFLVSAGAFAAKFTNLLAIGWPLGTALLLGQWRNPRLHLAAAVGLVLAPLSLLLLDPFFWPWQGGWDRFVDYLGQVGTRSRWIPISVYYMGENWGFRPPWHYRIVETLAALPLSSLLLFLPGLAYGATSFLRQLRRQAILDWPLALGTTGLGLTLVVGWLPSTPNHDLTRQFVFVFVPVALLSAGGVRAFGEGRPAMGRIGLVLGSVLALSSFLLALRAEPWGLGYRSEWMGGTRGARERGFEVSYWGEAIGPELLEAVDSLRPAPGTPPRILSVPKATYFRDAEHHWKPLVRPPIRDREVLAVDAVTAFYAPWIPEPTKREIGPWLRLTFPEPPQGILFFDRRGTIAESFRDVLDRLERTGDLERIGETRIDGVEVARLYRIVHLVRGRLPGDPSGRLWYQPRSLAGGAGAVVPGEPAPGP